MPEIVDALNRIENALNSSGQTGLLFQIASTMPAALIAAFAAIAATWASARSEKTRIEKNTAVSIYQEICSLRALINKINSKSDQNNYVRAPILSNREGICSLYLGAGTSLGSLKKAALEKVTKFYSTFLTLTPDPSIAANNTDNYLIDDLEEIEKLASASIQQLETYYSKYF